MLQIYSIYYFNLSCVLFKEYSEGTQAKEIFGGRMTQDFLAERLGHSNFMEVKELDFPQSSIQTVDLGDGHLFANLKRSVIQRYEIILLNLAL